MRLEIYQFLSTKRIVKTELFDTNSRPFNLDVKAEPAVYSDIIINIPTYGVRVLIVRDRTRGRELSN